MNKGFMFLIALLLIGGGVFYFVNTEEAPKEEVAVVPEEKVAVETQEKVVEEKVPTTEDIDRMMEEYSYLASEIFDLFIEARTTYNFDYKFDRDIAEAGGFSDDLSIYATDLMVSDLLKYGENFCYDCMFELLPNAESAIGEQLIEYTADRAILEFFVPENEAGYGGYKARIVLTGEDFNHWKIDRVQYLKW